jgi:hypothetical protein
MRTFGRAGFRALSIHADSHARAATINVSTPVSRVG